MATQSKRSGFVGIRFNRLRALIGRLFTHKRLYVHDGLWRLRRAFVSLLSRLRPNRVRPMTEPLKCTHDFEEIWEGVYRRCKACRTGEWYWHCSVKRNVEGAPLFNLDGSFQKGRWKPKAAACDFREMPDIGYKHFLHRATRIEELNWWKKKNGQKPITE